jgi:SAM-dependent methyltransferase
VVRSNDLRSDGETEEAGMTATCHCPVCDTDIEGFAPGGQTKVKLGVKCPSCRSNGRTRFAWLFLQRQTDFFDGRLRSMLHVAPERTLAGRFGQTAGVNYLSADFEADKALAQMDITDIKMPAESFDVIYCSHVLEHVSDDRQALREFFRVLKPSGWALLMVPIRSDETFEDPSITDPAERDRIFGQFDHVRNYGFDIADRIRAAGFDVAVHKPSDMLSDDERLRFGVKPSPSSTIFHAVKPAA